MAICPWCHLDGQIITDQPPPPADGCTSCHPVNARKVQGECWNCYVSGQVGPIPDQPEPPDNPDQPPLGLYAFGVSFVSQSREDARYALQTRTSDLMGIQIWDA